MSEQEPIRPEDKEGQGTADTRAGSEMPESGVPTFRLEERGSGEAAALATAAEKWAKLPEDLRAPWRSEEHTSELQSPTNLVCRLLLEKKKKNKNKKKIRKVKSLKEEKAH